MIDSFNNIDQTYKTNEWYYYKQYFYLENYCSKTPKIKVELNFKIY